MTGHLALPSDFPDRLREAWVRVTDESDPLAALSAVATVKDQLTEWEARLARRAMDAGASWETIGRALGVSRQAAWERLKGPIAESIEEDRRRLRAERARVRMAARRERPPRSRRGERDG